MTVSKKSIRIEASIFSKTFMKAILFLYLTQFFPIFNCTDVQHDPCRPSRQFKSQDSHLSHFQPGKRIPGEYEKQDRIFMIWPSTEARRWSGSDVFFNRLQMEISHIAKAISAFESLTLIVNPNQIKEILGPEFFSIHELSKISLILHPVNDIWARDCLPVFGTSNSHSFGVDLNYHRTWNGQEHQLDAQLASVVTKNLKISHRTTTLRMEGGALEFDGEGTLLATESSIFNTNRNPRFSSLLEVENELKRVFAIKKIIWFPGEYNGTDSTDVHIDALVRFVSPGVVVVDAPPKGYKGKKAQVCRNCSADAIKVLKNEKDAKGRKLKWFKISQPNPSKVWKTVPSNYDNAAVFSYVNFLITNTAVFVPQFGDEKADYKAVRKLKRLFHDREIVPVVSTHIGLGGGGVHCVTRNLPK